MDEFSGGPDDDSANDLLDDATETSQRQPGNGDAPRRAAPSRPPSPRVAVADIRRYLLSERREALETRDPIAIKKSGDRFDAISEILQEFPPDARIDIWAVSVGVSQAAKALGFNSREIRSLIRTGKIPARKVKNEWKIPLEVVL